MNLFDWGEFISHSELMLPFKINCDVLSNEDIKCIAWIIASKTSFGMVEGIPDGGCRLAAELEQYAAPDAPFNILIVDDVLTGESMELQKAKMPPQVHPDDVVGWVIFARTKPPDWVNAVFRLGDGLS